MILLVYIIFIPLINAFNCYTPCAELQDGSTISGVRQGNLDVFKGIPFATPPVGDLRFRPPVPYNKSLSGFNANRYGPQCYIQSPISLGFTDLPSRLVNFIENTNIFGNIELGSFGEDCLTLSIWRPPEVTSSDRLPVMFWIYPGGFSFGSVDFYNPSLIIRESIKMNQPVIIVVANHRLGAYGFLGGSDILKEGSANAGLLDQRMALKWVADNIESFGGNSNDVTIFGESAGSISVCSQMMLFNGDNTYKEKPLFHGAIMMSGSILPCAGIDSEYPQSIFNTLANRAGCGNSRDKMSCLRRLHPTVINEAQNTLPGFFGYHSVGLSFMPRPDGKVITEPTYSLVAKQSITQVPYIIGNQEDEGTIFALPLFNLTSSDESIGYLKYILPNVSDQHLQNAASLYPDDPISGSPYRTETFNQIYPEYKRLASFLGDIPFQWPRRFLLQNSPNVKKYSYLGRTFHRLPGLGSFHFGDTIALFYLDGMFFPSAKVYRQRWISFANHKDPNVGVEGIKWSEYGESNENFIIDAFSTSTAFDDYRRESSEYFNRNIFSGDLLF